MTNVDEMVRILLIAVSAVLALTVGAGGGLLLSSRQARPKWTANRGDVLLIATSLAGVAVCTLWSNANRLHQPVKPPAVGFLVFLGIGAFGVLRVVYRMARHR